jgi:hypothetical protein
VKIDLYSPLQVPNCNQVVSRLVIVDGIKPIAAPLPDISAITVNFQLPVLFHLSNLPVPVPLFVPTPLLLLQVFLMLYHVSFPFNVGANRKSFTITIKFVEVIEVFSELPLYSAVNVAVLSGLHSLVKIPFLSVIPLLIIL